MAWIELHQAVPTHRKTLALADALHIEPVQAVGHLCCLWLWTLDNSPRGALLDVSSRTIARAAYWRKDPAVFVDALVQAGLLDEDHRVHDWDDYIGRWIDKRAANTQRMRDARAAHVQRTNGARAGATVPNLTVPNLTVPDPPLPPLAQGGDARQSNGAIRDEVTSSPRRHVCSKRCVHVCSDEACAIHGEAARAASNRIAEIVTKGGVP